MSTRRPALCALLRRHCWDLPPRRWPGRLICRTIPNRRTTSTSRIYTFSQRHRRRETAIPPEKAASTSTMAARRTCSSQRRFRRPTTRSDLRIVGGRSRQYRTRRKVSLLDQDNFGLDVAVFPRVFLPSASPNVGDQHASYLLPIWMEKDWGQWSAFGGGGCEINRGNGSQDFCLLGRSSPVKSLQFTSRAGILPSDAGYARRRSHDVGRRRRPYDLNDNFHLLGYLGRGIQNAEATDRYNWYTAILLTF